MGMRIRACANCTNVDAPVSWTSDFLIFVRVDVPVVVAIVVGMLGVRVGALRWCCACCGPYLLIVTPLRGAQNAGVMPWWCVVDGIGAVSFCAAVAGEWSTTTVMFGGASAVVVSSGIVICARVLRMWYAGCAMFYDMCLGGGWSG